MPYTYPPAAPVVAGDQLTISTFLNNPTLVARRLRTLAEQRFIADALLTARMDVAGGAVQYETGESLYSEDEPEAIAPGGEYPITDIGGGESQIAKVKKWGQDSLVTDESIKRQRMNPVNRAMVKQVNQIVRLVDSVAMSAILSAVTATDSAGAAWDATTGVNILRDLTDAIAEIRGLNEGFEPDTLVVDDATWSVLVSDEKIAQLRAREDSSNPVYTGNFPVIAGLRVLPTPNMGVTKTALVVDSQQLGGMADERLGGPGYSSGNAGVGVEAKSIREDANDRWRIRARRVTVPVILEPSAAYKITGVLT